MSATKKSSTPAPRSKVATFAARLLSTVLLWGVIASALLWGPPWVIFAVAVFFGVGTVAEYVAMALPKDRARQILLTLGSFFCLALLSWLLLPSTEGISSDRVSSYTLGGTALMIFVGLFPSLLRTPSETEFKHLTRYVFGLLWITFLYSFILRLYAMDGPENGGIVRLLFLIAVAKFTDMGAYLTGTLIGRNKMIPHVSPGKTWEGFGGALVFAIGIAVGLVLLFPDKLAPLTPATAAVAGFVIALLAVIGDLAESVVKRVCEVKDSGNWLPGIGGILDLVDSLLFAAPALWLYLLWLSS